MTRRRGGALIEAVLVVMLLAIAVPPSMRFAEDIGTARTDAVLVERSAMLAQSVVEAVMADTYSDADGMGAAVLDDLPGYLDDPVAGLRRRIEAVTAGHAAVGLSFDVGAEDAVSADGTATGDAALDRYRPVTVTVRVPLSTGALDVPVSTMIDVAASDGGGV